MAQLITSPEKFAAEVNIKLLGAHRRITINDVRDMISCGLIGKYGFYGHLELEMVRRILLYEQLQQNRQKRDEIRDNGGVIHCRKCGAVLAARLKAKRGRPVEYCSECEPLRGRERYSRWRSRIKVAIN